MALFKIAEDTNGNKVKYKEEKDLYNLIDYCIRESKHTEVLGMIPGDSIILTNQFFYTQNCKGGILDTRALHFILSYDSSGWEWEMNIQKTIESIGILRGLRIQFDLEEYQTIIVAHDNQKNCNIHIIMNPVNKSTRKILHYNQYAYMTFLKELAFQLYMKYGLAVMGISYIGESSRCHLGENLCLYENRQYSNEPLRGKIVL